MDGILITVQPTSLRGWTWHLPLHYEVSYLHHVANMIINSAEGRAELGEIQKKLPLPAYMPCLRGLLRRHPEKIELKTDTTSSVVWAFIAGPKSLPTFTVMPLELGALSNFVPREYNWDDVKDQDSMKRIEQELWLPGRELEICVMFGKGLHRPEDITAVVNPTVVVYWDSDYDPEFEGAKFNQHKRSVVKIAETQRRFNTSNPIWGVSSYDCCFCRRVYNISIYCCRYCNHSAAGLQACHHHECQLQYPSTPLLLKSLITFLPPSSGCTLDL